MKELFDNIQVKMADMFRDMRANVANGNKAAGVRARKTTLEIEKLFKEYRKLSIEAAK